MTTDNTDTLFAAFAAFDESITQIIQERAARGPAPIRCTYRDGYCQGYADGTYRMAVRWGLTHDSQDSQDSRPYFRGYLDGLFRAQLK